MNIFGYAVGAFGSVSALYATWVRRRNAASKEKVSTIRADTESYRVAKDYWEGLLGDIKAEVSDLRGRVQELETERAYQRHRWSILLGYTRQLLAEMRRHDVPVPLAPDEIFID